MLNDELSNELKPYIIALRERGGVVNAATVIAASTGMLLERDSASLSCNGGHITLKKI